MRLSTEQKGFLIDALLSMRELVKDIPRGADHDHPLHKSIVMNARFVSRFCNAVMGNSKFDAQPIIEQFIFQPEVLEDISMEENFDEVAFVDFLEDMHCAEEF